MGQRQRPRRRRILLVLLAGLAVLMTSRTVLWGPSTTPLRSVERAVQVDNVSTRRQKETIADSRADKAEDVTREVVKQRFVVSKEEICEKHDRYRRHRGPDVHETEERRSLNTQRVDFQHEDAVHAWMHIPKTAGSTGYNLFMEPMVRANWTVYPRVGKHIYKTVTEGPIQFKAYDWNTPGCGNRTGGTHCARSEIEDCVSRLHGRHRPRVFYTIIRHPVERVISEYYWWYQQKSDAWPDRLNRRSLQDWVLDKSNVAHNRQALYFLLDTGFPMDPSISPPCAALAGDRTLDWIETKFGTISKFNEQQLANSILDKFGFIFVMEELEKSKTQFKKLFDVEFGPIGPSRRSELHRSKKHYVSPEIRKLIEEKNQLDMALYEMAKARLDC